MRKRGASSGPWVPFLAVAAAGAAVLAACTEDPLGGDPETSPGPTTPTLEFVVSADQVVWRDTTLTGFADPVDAGFGLAGDTEELEARVLGRFPLPDTFRVFADTAPPESFPSADIRVRLDTALSAVPELPVTLRLRALTRSFDGREATWEQARAGEPWTTPGGDLGPEIGVAVMETLADTVRVEFTVDVDSLLLEWSEGEGEPGFAALVEPEGTRLRIVEMRLRFEVILEGREGPIEQELLAFPRTFITDPALPAAEAGLRVGGIPSSRAYFVFVPPDTIEGVAVRGSRINHAQIILYPLEPPDAPWVLERPVISRPIELLRDPFELYQKTPIGSAAPQAFALDPDSLAVGRPIRLDITSVMIGQAALPPDSVEEVRLGIRPDPDAQAVGYWELGSVEAPPELRPRILIVLTPRSNLGVR